MIYILLYKTTYNLFSNITFYTVLPTLILKKRNNKSPQHLARAKLSVIIPATCEADVMQKFSYVTFNFVMLFAQMPIVDTLCKNADVVGESKPKNPPTSKLVLNVMIKR